MGIYEVSLRARETRDSYLTVLLAARLANGFFGTVPITSALAGGLFVLVDRFPDISAQPTTIRMMIS